MDDEVRAITTLRNKSDGTQAVEAALRRAREFIVRAEDYLIVDSGVRRASMLRESMELTRALAQVRRTGR